MGRDLCLNPAPRYVLEILTIEENLVAYSKTNA